MSKVDGTNGYINAVSNYGCTECCDFLKALIEKVQEIVQWVIELFWPPSKPEPAPPPPPSPAPAQITPPPVSHRSVSRVVVPTSLTTRRGINFSATARLSHSAPRPAPPIHSAKDMISYAESCWNAKYSLYQGIDFDGKKFNELAEKHNAQFPLLYDPVKEFGYIEKRDVAAGSKIFVRADLHGDLKSLMENLKTLQKEGLLDAEFKCKGDVQLVFVGDFADRGRHSMQVIELLMRLRMENPNNVTLIRGNHESVNINVMFGRNDKQFLNYLSDETNRSVLESFYMRLPLTSYLGNEQYVQYTHGLFELSADPSEMLDSPEPVATMAISKERKLSDRISRLDKEGANEKIRAAAKRIQELWKQDVQRQTDITTYNWGDMETSTHLGNPENRKWKMSVEDVKHYLRVCQSKKKVKMLFRGHEHAMKHHTIDDKIVATTLTVGMDTPYKQFLPQPDCAYILTVGAKVKEWNKKALLAGSPLINDQHHCGIQYPRHRYLKNDRISFNSDSSR